jgi:hypothetical protein
MTMQSSGPISLCQAAIECQLGYPITINAGNSLVSELGYVSSGQALAWSYWYGQQYLAPIPYQIAVDYQAVVDRDFTMTYDYRTGAYSYTIDSYNNNARLLYFTPHLGAVPTLPSYTSFSGTFVMYEGRSTYEIYQSPSPSNDYTIIANFDDNGPSGASTYGAYLYIKADNRFG